MSKSKLSINNGSNEANNAKTAQVTQDKTASKSKSLSRPEDYSHASSICKALYGKTEGNVDFNSVLTDAHMHRSSTLQIIKHMVNFNILEVSFNSSQTVGEKRKSWAFIRIIRNPETQEQLPKSA